MSWKVCFMFIHAHHCSFSFGIGTTAANHTVEFTKAARTEQAHAYTLRASRCLAKTAASIYLDEDLYRQAVADFKKGKPQ